MVGPNQISVFVPGSTSCLMRKAGTKNEWITSCEVMISLTGLPTGTCSASISRAPFGCCVFHIHCLAVTCTSSASSGGLSSPRLAEAAHQNTNRNSSSVAAVQPISNSRLTIEGSGPRFAFEPRR